MMTLADEREIIFYDGSCALCHWIVRWVIAHDPAGHFQFAPFQGRTFSGLSAVNTQELLPKSVVVRTADGGLLVRSQAVTHVMSRLGGGNARLARILGWLPRFLRDAGYDLIAKVRYAVFGRKAEFCPMVPLELRDRFLD